MDENQVQAFIAANPDPTKRLVRCVMTNYVHHGQVGLLLRTEKQDGIYGAYLNCAVGFWGPSITAGNTIPRRQHQMVEEWIVSVALEPAI